MEDIEEMINRLEKANREKIISIEALVEEKNEGKTKPKPVRFNCPLGIF